MDDIKREARDAKTDAKEAWRKADGESLGDKAATARDRVEDAAKDAGDALHRGVDNASREAAYQRGRIDQEVDRDEPA
jgi:hypothetical protein